MLHGNANHYVLVNICIAVQSMERFRDHSLRAVPNLCLIDIEVVWPFPLDLKVYSVNAFFFLIWNHGRKWMENGYPSITSLFIPNIFTKNCQGHSDQNKSTSISACFSNTPTCTTLIFYIPWIYRMHYIKYPNLRNCKSDSYVKFCTEIVASLS